MYSIFEKIRKNLPSLARDTALSCLGSLAAFLLLRLVTEPSYGYTQRLLIYLAGAFIFGLIGYAISGLSKVIRDESSSWGGRRIIYTMLVKEVGLLALLASGLVGKMELGFEILTVFADFIFSSFAVWYPRSIANRIHKEDRQIRALSTTMNAMVVGTHPESVKLAKEAEASGQYCVLGLLSRNPDYNGKMIDDFLVYSALSDDDIQNIQWKLGGIDCLLFPKGRTGLFNKDPETPADANEVPVKDHMNAAGRFVKRSFDIALSGLLLIVFSPLFLICWLAVLIEDGKPVIYRQERIGRGGKPFDILKFRTMGTDAEQNGPALYQGDDDPRLTRVGKFLRQHHLDELPQLWNVFRGDMSFIGYRPERSYYIDRIMQENPRYRYLYQIRPGITSYATLYNGYTDSIDKMLVRLNMDLYYLRNHSIGFDIRILGLTFLGIVGGRKF